MAYMRMTKADILAESVTADEINAHFARDLWHIKYIPAERLSQEVVLVDGRYYRQMTDKECAEFIWGVESK